jgi:hypothetical protein
VRILIIILSALVLREAWLVIPESTNSFDPYPYFDAQVTRQYYFYYAFYYASNLILVYAFLEAVNKYKEFFHLWFALQTVELIDYFLTYNTAWYKIPVYIGLPLGWDPIDFTINVGITLVKLITLTITILFLWNRSSHSKQ